MSMSPVVSVIITTFKRPELLVRAIESVLSQTYRDFEIIVVDDANSSASQAKVHTIDTGSIPLVYLKNDVPKGANYSRNKGIRHARGKFVAGLDDDDEFLPERLEVLLENFDASYAFVTSLNVICKDNEVNISKCPAVVRKADMLKRNILLNQGLIEKSKMLAVGLYDETLPSCQDYDMWLRLILRYGDVKVVQHATQKIHMPVQLSRITSNSNTKVSGYLKFYKSYKYLMSQDERLIHLSAIRKLKKPESGIHDIAIAIILKKIELLNIRCVSIYGGGLFCDELYPSLRKNGIEISSIVDSRLHGTNKFGIRILQPEEWLKTSEQVIVIASTEFREEMIEGLFKKNTANKKLQIV